MVRGREKEAWTKPNIIFVWAQHFPSHPQNIKNSCVKVIYTDSHHVYTLS